MVASFTTLQIDFDVMMEFPVIVRGLTMGKSDQFPALLAEHFGGTFELDVSELQHLHSILFMQHNPYYYYNKYPNNSE